MIVEDHLRSRADDLEFRAHFLQSGRKGFNLLLLRLSQQPRGRTNYSHARCALIATLIVRQIQAS